MHLLRCRCRNFGACRTTHQSCSYEYYVIYTIYLVYLTLWCGTLPIGLASKTFGPSLLLFFLLFSLFFWTIVFTKSWKVLELLYWYLTTLIFMNFSSAERSLGVSTPVTLELEVNKYFFCFRNISNIFEAREFKLGRIDYHIIGQCGKEFEVLWICDLGVRGQSLKVTFGVGVLHV